MHSILLFSAVCIGLASAGAHHAYHSGGNDLGYSSGASQQRQLVDVPYTVEYRSVSSGSGKSYGGSSSVRQTYQQQQQPQVQIQRAQLVEQRTYSQPQVQFQRAQPVQQRSYSQPQVQRAQPVQQRSYSQPQQRRQSQQLVDVPYTVETVQRSSGSASSSSGQRHQSYSNAGNSRSVQVHQTTPLVHAVGVSHAIVPVSLGHVVLAHPGLSGSIGAISPSYIIY